MGKKRTRRAAPRPMETPQARTARVAREIGVPEIQIEHGLFEETKVVDIDGDLGGGSMSIQPVLINRGGTAVERWFAAHPDLFGEGQQRAIGYCRSLWARVDGMTSPDPTRDVIDAPLGWSQHEALTELSLLKGRTPPTYWSVYENVCRFDEPAGAAGSSLATNSRAALASARITVAFTASLIAMWRRL